MTPRRLMTFFTRAAIVPIATVALLGYGSAAGASTAPQKAAKAKPATVRIAKTKLGNVLVNSKGRTLYMFQAEQGTTSACNDACAVQWPPLTNASPKAGKGAKASLLTTATRADGSTQVVYNGHPLYTFMVDKKAGDTNGQGVNAFGGVWFALTPAGNQVTATAPSAPSSPSSGGGGSSGTPGY
jgi:predicted lipoprotein with Yx(FWY)xxD motif